MISRFLKYGFRTSKVGNGGSRAAQSTHWSEQRPPRAGTPSIGAKTVGKRTRLFFLFLALACIPVTIIATVKQYRTAGALEKKLAAERVCQAAGELDGLLAVRSSAVRMSAGNLELENLSSSAELNKILNSLKELFPDFLSLDICNEHGQTVAMMGDLSLAQVGRKGKSQEPTKMGIALPGQTMQFRDNPADNSFFITLRHRGADGAVWYSRSRFSRSPIDLILGSPSEAKPLRLVMVSESEGRSAAEATKARSVTAAREYSVTTDRSWLPRTIAATASLNLRGWAVSSETPVQGSTLYPVALITSALIITVCALAGVRSKPETMEACHVYARPHRNAVHPAPDPESAVPVSVPAGGAHPDNHWLPGKAMRDRLSEPLVAISPLPEQEPTASGEDEFFSGYSDAHAPATEAQRMRAGAEGEKSCNPEEDFCFGNRLTGELIEEGLPGSTATEPNSPPQQVLETDFGGEDRYWPAVEVLPEAPAEELRAAIDPEQDLPMGEVVTELAAEESSDFDSLLPATRMDAWTQEPLQQGSARKPAFFENLAFDRDLPSDELPYDVDYYAESLPESEFCYDAEIPHAAEPDRAAWDPELPKEWDESLVGAPITGEAAREEPAETTAEAELSPGIVESEDCIPDSLEITWFEPESESAVGPAEPIAPPSRDTVNPIRFVSV